MDKLGDSINTTHGNLKIIRRILNEGISEDLL